MLGAVREKPRPGARRRREGEAADRRERGVEEVGKASLPLLHRQPPRRASPPHRCAQPRSSSPTPTTSTSKPNNVSSRIQRQRRIGSVRPGGSTGGPLLCCKRHVSESRSARRRCRH
ncbi:hypothetical protein BRADI_4g23075v3 [Brachypodium distachyon]|uniref:Uncharacterized protein n=1 Tax=Brachypodium distachyon TaxID=15368 RepID=A0A0Q3ENE8_BRADI|nr:hypothetical protein BRADI_4g23075v3 [Brachypodium distachyon]